MLQRGKIRLNFANLIHHSGDRATRVGGHMDVLYGTGSPLPDSVGNFAIFNIADASISVGVVVLILGVWITEMTDKRRAAAQKAAAPASDEGEGKGG